jgi:hypothetical protein
MKRMVTKTAISTEIEDHHEDTPQSQSEA